MPVSTPHRNLIWDYLAPSSLWSCFFFWIYFSPPKIYTHMLTQPQIAFCMQHPSGCPFPLPHCKILCSIRTLKCPTIHTPYTQVSNWQILTRPVTSGLPVIIDANRAELGFCLGVVLLKTVMWKYDWSLFSRSHTASLSHTVKHRLLHSVPPHKNTHAYMRKIKYHWISSELFKMLALEPDCLRVFLVSN